MSERLMTLAEAMSYLAEKGRPVARQTVWRWVKDGKLPAKRRKGGRNCLYAQSDLDVMLQLEDVAA